MQGSILHCNNFFSLAFFYLVLLRVVKIVSIQYVVTLFSRTTANEKCCLAVLNYIIIFFSFSPFFFFLMKSDDCILTPKFGSKNFSKLKGNA